MEFFGLMQCNVLSDFVSASASQNIMQVALCTLHDDPFQRADQFLLCTKKILELAS
jgi:hypothetical protein